MKSLPAQKHRRRLPNISAALGFLFLFLLAFINGCSLFQAEVPESNAPYVDSSYIFTPTQEGTPETTYHVYVYGLNTNEIDVIKASPHFVSMKTMNNGRLDIEFKCSYKYIFSTNKYIIDRTIRANDLYSALFHIKKRKIGNSVFYEFGGGGPPSWAVADTRGALGFSFRYSCGEIRIKGLNQAIPQQLFHDMEDWFNPDTIKLRKVGRYSVIDDEGTTYWPINNQMYIIISTYEFNEDLVKEYSDRLGNILPDDYKYDYDKWVIDDIHWKMKFWDKSTNTCVNGWYLIGGAQIFVSDIMYFWGYRGEGPSGIDDMFRNSTSMIEAWNLQYRFRCWLWANAIAHNFKKQSPGGYHILKGPSMFDFKNGKLIDLPPEIKGPPCPTPEDVELIRQQSEELRRRQYQYLVDNAKRDGVKLIHTDNCNCSEFNCKHAEKRIESIKKYIADYKLNADIKYFTSFQFEILREGTGPSPSITDCVRVQFDGKYVERDFFIDLVNPGKIMFATSRENPEPSLWSLKKGKGEVCSGLTDALLKMKVGGKYRVMLPVTLKHDYDQVYWDGSGSSLFHTVIYEIELIDIVDKETAEARYRWPSGRFNLDEYFKEYEDTKEKPEGVSK